MEESDLMGMVCINTGDLSYMKKSTMEEYEEKIDAINKMDADEETKKRLRTELVAWAAKKGLIIEAFPWAAKKVEVKDGQTFLRTLF